MRPRRGMTKKPQQPPPRKHPLHLEQLSSMIRLDGDSSTTGRTVTDRQGVFSTLSLAGTRPPPGGGGSVESPAKSPATASPSPAPAPASASLRNDAGGEGADAGRHPEASVAATAEGGGGGDGNLRSPQEGAKRGSGEKKRGSDQRGGGGGEKHGKRGSDESAPKKRGSGGRGVVAAVEANDGVAKAKRAKEEGEEGGTGGPPERAVPRKSTQQVGPLRAPVVGEGV